MTQATLSLTGSGDWQVLELLYAGLLSTGAIFGVVGLGLFAWRQRRKH